MSAIGRLGAEWKMGYTEETGRSIHGAFSNTGLFGGLPKSEIVEPGRTGGAMFRLWGGPTGTPLGNRKLPTHISLHPDLATNEDPGVHGGIGDPDAYVLPEGEFLIGRAYMRIPAAPDAPGVFSPSYAPGIPIMVVGGTSPSTFGLAGGALGIWLANDRTLRVLGAAAFGMGVPDVDFDWPVDEWVMLEAAINYETTEPRRAFVRVTLEGEEPVVIYRNCNIPPLAGDHDFFRLQSVLSCGVFQYQATSFDPGNYVSESWYIDVDDMGVNTSEGEENNTWCGPGRARVARPIADGEIGPAWTVGQHSSTYRGEQGRTIPDHPCELLPPVAACDTCTDDVDSVEGCVPDGFWEALNNNPIVNPASAPAESFGRCRTQDRMVSSVGTDWHIHTNLVGTVTDGLGPCTFTLRYDDPRLAFAGDTMELVCDASDRVGDIAFARVVAFAGKQAWFGGPSDVVQFPFRGDYYFSMWTDNEEEPLLGGPVGGGFSDDLAHTDFGMWMQTAPTIDTAWRAALGRFQQLPDLAVTPSVFVRREHFQHVLANHGGVGATPESFSALQEFILIGLGVIYESDFTPQDPLPDCSPGELVIGDANHHLRQVLGGRIALGDGETHDLD